VVPPATLDQEEGAGGAKEEVRQMIQGEGAIGALFDGIAALEARAAAAVRSPVELVGPFMVWALQQAGGNQAAGDVLAVDGAPSPREGVGERAQTPIGDTGDVLEDGYKRRCTKVQKAAMEEALPGILEDVPADMRDEVAAALRRFAHVFSDVEGGCIRVPPVGVPVKSEEEQLACPKRRKTFCQGYASTPKERRWVEAKFEEYQRLGLMKAHLAPSKTASPAFAVGSPGLSEHRNRVVVDFSFVNWLLQDIQFPAARFEDLLLRIAASRWFSLLDLKGGYHQVPIDEETQRLLTISWDGRLFRPLVLWEGVGTAPAIFQSLMARLFEAVVRLAALVIYLDDHLVHSRTPRQHLHHLTLYLQQCERWNVTLKLAKCQFFRQQLRWLGRVVGHGLVQADPAYIAKLKEYKRPSSKEELWRYLGCCVWVVRYLPGAQLALAPLYDLLTRSFKRQPLQWCDKTKEAWAKMQQLVQHPQALAIPRVAQRFGIVVDASVGGWGALLLQEGVEGKGDWRVVSMTAKRWKTKRDQELAEQLGVKGARESKAARPLELRGLAAALKEWAVYVKNGRPIMVLTDHRPLADKLRPQPHDTDSLREVLGTILSYPVEVAYIPGGTMPADWPSREGLQFAE
jgi:hypothetical protein